MKAVFSTAIPRDVQKSSLFLFNSFVIPREDIIPKSPENYYTNEKIGKYGLVFHKLLKNREDFYLKIYLELYPFTKVNNTFWTFFDTIQKEEDGTRIFYQLTHYLTTYGAEYLGIKELIKTYIPNEKYGIDAEGFIKNIKIISAINLMELRNKVYELLNVDRGYSNQQIEYILTLVKFLFKRGYFTKSEILDIKNRDLLVKICDMLDLLPLDFDLFLHFAFQKWFNSRKIKSRSLLERIRRDYNFVHEFERYVEEFGEDGMKEMARCFRRNKEIILAVKTSNFEISPKLRKAINKAKKLSDKGLHEPVRIKLIRDMYIDDFEKLVEKSKLSDLVKYLVYFRKLKNNIAGYIIRNGKVWIESEKELVFYRKDQMYMEIVEEELRKRIEKIFGDIKVHSKHIIALPTSMTHFIGNVPLFSSFEFDKNRYMLIGIHWFNLKDERVDLDLHTSIFDENSYERIGWNSSWENGEVVFSGDMTDAPHPHGASEFVLIRNDFKKKIIFSVCDFTQNVYKQPEYTFSLVFGNKNDSQNFELHEELTKENSEITMCDIEAIIPINFKNESNQLLGYYNNGKFIFCNWSLMKTRVVFDNEELYRKIGEFIDSMYNITPKLNDYVDVDEKDGIRLDTLDTEFWKEYFKV